MPISCTNCGYRFKDSYLKICDNFLQVKYFDDDDNENAFCSAECIAEFLSVKEIYLYEGGEDDEDCDRHTQRI